MEKEEKYVLFNKWAKENGIISDAVRYPVAFGENGELVGMAAARDIGVNEAYLYVPQKVIICESTFKKSEIGHLLEKHKDFFDDEHKIIMFFVMHEMSKGEDSFWYPTFLTSEKPDLPIFWTDEELAELQDIIIDHRVKEER